MSAPENLEIAALIKELERWMDDEEFDAAIGSAAITASIKAFDDFAGADAHALSAEHGSLPEAVRHGIIRNAAWIYRQFRSACTGNPPASVAALWRPWRRLTGK